jgi:hypothetical protein
MTYHGRFYRSALYLLLQRINTYLPPALGGLQVSTVALLQALHGMVVWNPRQGTWPLRPLALDAHVCRIQVRRAE